jgi:membrane protease YdiL (CAAX protease family)
MEWDWANTSRELLTFLAPSVLLVALAAWQAPQRRVCYAVLFLGVVLLDFVVMVLPIAMHWQPDALQWNWLGKFFNVVVALLVLRFSPLTRHEIGLTLNQRPNSMLIGLLVIVCVAIFWPLFNRYGPVPHPIETLAFQATMPSLAEELAFRGIYLALLVRALGGHMSLGMEGDLPGNRRAVLIAATILILGFGLGHVLRSLVAEGFTTAALGPFVWTSFAALILTWLRLRTGSLLLPMLCHSAMNLSVFIGSLLSQH